MGPAKGYVLPPCMHALCLTCFEAERRDAANEGYSLPCMFKLDAAGDMACSTRIFPLSESSNFVVVLPSTTATTSTRREPAGSAEEVHAKTVAHLEELERQRTVVRNRIAELERAIGLLGETIRRLVHRRANRCAEVRAHYNAVLAALSDKHLRRKLDDECAKVLGDFAALAPSLSADIKALQDQCDSLFVVKGQYEACVKFDLASLLVLAASASSSAQPSQSGAVTVVTSSPAGLLLLDQFARHVGRLLEQPISQELVVKSSADIQLDVYAKMLLLMQSTAAATGTKPSVITVPHVGRIVQRQNVVGLVPMLNLSWLARDYTQVKDPVAVLHRDVFGSIYGVTCDHHGNLLFNDTRNWCIHTLGSKDNTKRNTQAGSSNSSSSRRANLEGDIHTLHNTLCSYGVCVSTAGDILNAPLTCGKLQAIDPKTGTVWRVFSSEFTFTQSTYIATAPDDSILVGCSELNKVVKFNADGTQAWCSIGQGFAFVTGLAWVPEPLEHDKAVTTMVAVCDVGKHRIQLLAFSDGRFLREIGGQGKMSFPRAIAYDAIARVFIVCETKCISVWALDGTFVHRWGPRSHFFPGAVAVSSIDSTVVVISNVRNGMTCQLF